MKIFPLILSLLLFVSGVFPCVDGAAYLYAEVPQTEAQTLAEDKHSCCQTSEEEDNETEEGHCTAACSCYCCMLIISPLADLLLLPSKLYVLQSLSWQVNNYTHDFTPVIWQPPQLT